MAHIPLRRFDQGLWLTPSEDEMPPGSLRRAVGVGPLQTNTIRSRDGSRPFETGVSPHSIYRFAGSWYTGQGGNLHRDWSAIESGLNGNRLSFARMGPTSGIEDYLFVAGGGKLFKVDSTGASTQWGIDPPADGMTAARGSALTKEIDYFNSSPAANWTASGDVWTGSLAASTLGKYEGTSSLRGTVVGRKSGTLTRTFGAAIDLSEFADDTEPSSDLDYIEFAFHQPAGSIEYLELQILTSTNSGYSKRYIFGEPSEAQLATLPEGTLAYIATLYGLDAAGQARSNFEAANAAEQAFADERARLAKSAQRLDDVSGWVKVRTPKTAFLATGPDADWSVITQITWTVYTRDFESSRHIYFDMLGLHGGYPLAGTYKYYVTFRNSVTGTRSNANETSVEIEDVEREQVELADIPTSTDPQVDQREIWRTLSNGAVFFKCATIEDNTTTTYTDEVADFPSNDVDSYLSGDQLPTDNTVPYAFFDDCVGPWNASMFWITRTEEGEMGRVYYSPIGRAEGMQGFIDIGSDDDPLQKLVMYRGSLYAATKSAWYEIVGTNPYMQRKISGVPGTGQPHTVCPTPYGIAYFAHDGVRLFDGLQGTCISTPRIELLVREGTGTYCTSFVGRIGCYARGEYFISSAMGSDHTRTLAVNLTTGSWRELGHYVDAFHYAEAENRLAATLWSPNEDQKSMSDIERKYNTTDNWEPIYFDAETFHVRMNPEQPVLVRWVHIDWGGPYVPEEPEVPL